MARIHVAQPAEVRESFIPETVLNKKKYDKNDPNRPMLARDVEEANGGAGVFNVDLKADYLLENAEWKHDKIPEIYDGKNIYDFVDPDIEVKLQALEEEEEKLEAEGYYDSDEEIDDVETAEVRRKADQIRTKQALIRNEARMRRIKNRAALPRSAIKKPLSQLEDSLDQLGVDTEDLNLRGRSQTISRGRSVTRSRLGTEDPNAMDIDQTPRERLRSKSRARSQPATNRREDGIVDLMTRTKAEKQAKLAQRKTNRNARQGEGDRHTTASLAKHLVCTIAPNTSPQIWILFSVCFFSFLIDANVLLRNSSRASDPSARPPTVKYGGKLVPLSVSCFYMINMAAAARILWLSRCGCLGGKNEIFFTKINERRLDRFTLSLRLYIF